MTQKILVVDDSRTVRTVVEWVFHGSPYTIIGAATASDAVRMMREHRPAVALIDYALPDQSGFELCQEIRNDRDLSSIPLVMMGGTWGGFDETRAAACADDYIYKPFKTDALIEKVSQAASRASVRPPQLTPDDARTVAGMPAVPLIGGLPGAPRLPPLRPPTQPPAHPAAESGGGFRRVQSGQEVAAASTLQVGPPPLPQVKGPPPSATPLPTPIEDHARVEALPPLPPPTPPRRSAAVPPPAALPQTQPPATYTPPTPYTPPASYTPPAPAAAVPAPLPAVHPLPIPAAVEPSVAPAAAERDASEPTSQNAVVEPSVLTAAPVEIDEAHVRELVREMLPPIVKEVLAGLLRQTIGTRVEAYATKKIDSFIDGELPAMAEKAIDAQLEVLYANVEE